MSGVVLDGVSAGYRGQQVLHAIDLVVAPGEWLGIIGPNGSGKSTLLKVAAGLLDAEGEVLVNGVAMAGRSRRELAREVALVPQTPVIPAGTTVFDYVLLGRNPHVPYWNSESAGDLAVAREELSRLDLIHLADRPVEELSGGERQRAVLARALTQRPSVLPLDEPTTGLDLGHQQDFLASVAALSTARGIAVLSALHDLTLAAQYAGHLMMLSEGRIVATGSAGDVLTEERLRTYFDADVVVTHIAGDPAPVVVPRRATDVGDGEVGQVTTAPNRLPTT